jgi:hypothetical protein
MTSATFGIDFISHFQRFDNTWRDPGPLAQAFTFRAFGASAKRRVAQTLVCVLQSAQTEVYATTLRLALAPSSSAPVANAERESRRELIGDW